MNIYIDESGCLGFDLAKQGTSSHLIFVALVIQNNETKKNIAKAVLRTLKNKINHHKAASKLKELKGHLLPLQVKKYFYTQISENDEWDLYVVAASKLKWLNAKNNRHDPSLFYDAALIQLLKMLPVASQEEKILIVIDQSKNQTLREKLNERLKIAFYANKEAFSLFHRDSTLEPNLQAVDLFANGVLRKIEHANSTWYEIFESKIKEQKII